MSRKNPTQAEIAQAAATLGRPIDNAQAGLLLAYLEQLIKWNRKMNLVGPSDWDDIIDTLVVDSLFLADFLGDLNTGDEPLTLDLGAGAGLPGIPLRILWQAGSYWLVEVREKRSTFMRSVLGKLRLPNTHVFHGKAEHALENLTESGNTATADLILSRAFMPWPKLLEFVHPMLKDNGTIVIMANTPPPADGELPDAWKLGDVARYPAAGNERYFWSLIKR